MGAGRSLTSVKERGRSAANSADVGSSTATAAGRRRAAKRAAPTAGGKGTRPRGAGGAAKPASRRPRPTTRAKPGSSKAKRTARTSKPAARKAKGRSRASEASWRGRLLVAIAALAALAAGYFGWFRDSSLVAIEKVTIEGATSAEADRVTAALTDAATGMSTLNVQEVELERAVAGFPTVEGLETDTGFPDAITITVAECRPALLVAFPGSTVPAAADGTLLEGLELPDGQAQGLPTVAAPEPAGSGSLEGEVLQQALVVGAAPGPLAPLIERVSPTDQGVELSMRGGVEIDFGGSSRAGQKWDAAAAVLADPKLESVSYVDVRVPERPAVGGAAEASEPLP